ncbi:hypothetical protein GH714_002737 [Hevea brasiliensis]|uniref:Uncharacterized protein n=1 Tax=Hevea brasiliensis TaxID=3981 RepID=A0A6A6LUN6_HEVBR|nr:hypothetical protein GH714_002737 [Hevea brasiliensis]
MKSKERATQGHLRRRIAFNHTGASRYCSAVGNSGSPRDVLCFPTQLMESFSFLKRNGNQESEELPKSTVNEASRLNDGEMSRDRREASSDGGPVE